MCTFRNIQAVPCYKKKMTPVVGIALCLALVSGAGCVDPIAQEFVTIDTDLGKIRGIVKSARNGKPFEVLNFVLHL